MPLFSMNIHMYIYSQYRHRYIMLFMVLNKPGNADISFALDTYREVALQDQMVDLFFVFKVFCTF